MHLSQHAQIGHKAKKRRSGGVYVGFSVVKSDDKEAGRKIGYARVSTEDQNPELQIKALEKAGCSEIFTDHGVSGASSRRPELSKALAKLGEGDSLVVWKLDRLGRSVMFVVKLVLDLEKRGVKFLSLTESISTTGSVGKLMLYIFALMAQFERSIIAERTKAGLKVRKAQGKRLGRPPALTAEQIELAEEIVGSRRKTLIATARMFNVDKSVLSRALKRRREQRAGGA